jgi:lipid-binding SYLF domain-containing protein
MKSRLFNGTMLAFALGAALSVFTAQAADVTKSECKEALARFKNADPTLQNMLSSAAGYAIFPNVGKGGFIVGGAHGTGCVFQNGQVIGQARMTQATIGAQAGGQSYSELIVFQDQTALDSFKSGGWEMRAGVSGVAAAQGASQVARFNQGVAVFTLARRGLMGEAAVGGQRFSFTPMTIK